jgi:hypothetical protein
MTEQDVASLLRATRKAVVAVRHDLTAALETLRAHELAGFGGLSTDRARAVEQQVLESDLIIRDIAGVLFVADGPSEHTPNIIQEFVAKWGSR